MSATKYYEKITQILANIHETQNGAIKQAAEQMAKAIAAGIARFVEGSG